MKNMNSGRLLKLFSIYIAVFWMSACKNEVKKLEKSSDNKRPNILYIMSDDHASNAISAYGSRLKDIAPTLLYSLGIDFPESFQGRNIFK